MFYYYKPESGRPDKEYYGQHIGHYALFAGARVFYVHKVSDYKDANQDNYRNFQRLE